MRAHYTHSFFCGHLFAKTDKIDQLKLKQEWIDTRLSNQTYKQYCNIFYEGFVDSILPVQERVSNDRYSELTHLISPINRSVIIQLSNDSMHQLNLELVNIHLFKFPFDVVLFAIETKTNDVNLDDLTLTHFKLRNINNYHHDEAIAKSGLFEVLKPLLDLCGTDDNGDINFTNLEHTGNKLKIFQVVHCDELLDSTLYEIGSLSPIGSVNDHTNANSPSDEYFQEAIKKHKISVFCNWSALTLFDTTTILRVAPKPNADQFDQWSSNYFRVVYLHCLYQKTLLFGINQQFRASSVNRNQICKLMKTMKEQDYHYAFSNISYNFLPQIIYDKVLQSFDVAAERKQLKYYLDQEENKQRDASNGTINIILTFIALLSILSTLYDGTSLIKDTFDIDTGSTLHRIIVFSSSACVLLLLIIFSLSKLKQKIWKRK